MNMTMKWLLKREFWEHKGGFFWAPIVVGAIIALGVLVSTVTAIALKTQHGVTINGQQVTNLGAEIGAEKLAMMASGVSQGYVLTSGPLFMVMAVVIFFFSLGTLFDERKDRSVLFWKSLPVSDGETVASKAMMALLVAPLITFAAGLVTSVIVLIIAMVGAAATGVPVAGAVAASLATYTSPFALLALLPVYIVWALPTVGWLMMVSAWARTKVFLWAVGVPVLTGVLLSWFNAMFDFNWDVKWFWANIVGRGLLSVTPGAWFAFVDPPGGVHNLGHGNTIFLWPMVAQSWKTLASVHAVLGAVLGGGMLYAAARIRRWKDEG